MRSPLRFHGAIAGLMLAVALALPAAPPAVAAARAAAFAVPKDDRSPLIGPSPARTAFACDGAPVLTIAVGADSLDGTTVGEPDRTSGYSCVAWDESGGEAIYRLDVTQDVTLTVTLTDLTADLDVFLLSACDGDSCLAAGSQGFAVRTPPGSYLLTVDGYQGVSGTFRLLWRAHAAGVPAAVCAGGALPITCAATPFDLPLATLWGAPNLVETYACAPILVPGGEAWYAVTMADSSEFTALVSNVIFDAALWLFDGCGPDAVCLAFRDAAAAGGAEELRFANTTSARRTVYFAVDSVRPIPDPYSGDFHLRITCTKPVVVPLDRAGWGAVKGLYGPRRSGAGAAGAGAAGAGAAGAAGAAAGRAHV
ncbi:MAG: hypothetical protein ACYDIE_05005 [Candidatus Krumholzibacteriia bacterium]